MSDEHSPTPPKAPARKFLKAVMGGRKPLGMTQVAPQQGPQLPVNGGRTPLPMTPVPNNQRRIPPPSNTDNTKK